MKFEELYKSLIEKHSEIPQDVWSGVSEQLDIDDVWGSINQELDKRDRWVIWRNWASGIAALLLIGFGSFTALQYSSNNSKNTATTEKLELPNAQNIDGVDNNQTIDANKSIDHSSTNKVHSDVIPTLEHISGNEIKANSKQTNSTVQELEDESTSFKKETVRKEIVKGVFVNQDPKDQNKLTPHNLTAYNLDQENIAQQNDLKDQSANRTIIDKLSPRTLGYSDVTPVNALITGEIEELEEKKRGKVQLKYVGFNTAIRNHWLLNHDTRKGLSAKEISSTDLSFNQSLGANLGIKIGSSSIGIQSNFISNKGGGYKDYIRGRIIERSINMSYFSSTVFIKPFSEKIRYNRTLLLGFYLDYLKTAIVNYRGESTDVTSSYKSFDYGFVVGKEYPIKLGKHAQVSPYATLSYGLTNVFKGNEEIPSSFDNTQNMNIDVGVSLRYIL